MTVNESEREWQAERDADVLMEYSAIKSDLKRLLNEHCALKSVAKVSVENPDITDHELGLIAHQMSFVVEDDFPDGAEKFLEIASNLM